MNRHKLPTQIEIKGNSIDINSDYRDIIDIFIMMDDPDLLQEEKLLLALEMFYKTDAYLDDVDTAISEMFLFMNAGEAETKKVADEKPLYDWEQDFNIIVAPINKSLGTDVRGLDYLHWWTFLSAFMEIGECTFSTYVGIRDKKNHGKRLDKHEEKIYRDNKDKILLKKKYDTTTQDILAEILGY